MPPSATKVLQINPDLFSMKKNSTGSSQTLKKEKKQKPSITTNSSTLRKNLLSKIRDFQKKEEHSSNKTDNSKLPSLEEVKEFDGEFNKSLQFLEELANKHKATAKIKMDKKRENQQIIQTGGQNVLVEQPQQSQQSQENKLNNKTVKRRNKNTRQLMVNSELPEELKIDTSLYYGGNSSPEVTMSVPASVPASVHMQQPITFDQVPIIQAPIILNQPLGNIENVGNTQIQTTPSIDISTSPSSTITLKEPPPYSNLKGGGNKPTYKEWVKTTQKIHHKPSETNSVNIKQPEGDKQLSYLKEKYSNHSNATGTSKHKVPRKHLVKVKTKTIKYNLGKRGKTVSVLIKNNTTRKKVNDEFAQLKIKPINEVKDFLKSKNLIKAGTTAPTDVLRTMYEQTILSGDLTNESKDNLIHNFMSK